MQKYIQIGVAEQHYVVWLNGQATPQPLDALAMLLHDNASIQLPPCHENIKMAQKHSVLKILISSLPLSGMQQVDLRAVDPGPLGENPLTIASTSQDMANRATADRFGGDEW